MSIASIQSFSESGTCAYCRREDKEGLICSFGDGSFSGFLCKADFWRFVRLRAAASDFSVGLSKRDPVTGGAGNGH